MGGGLITRGLAAPGWIVEGRASGGVPGARDSSGSAARSEAARHASRPLATILGPVVLALAVRYPCAHHCPSRPR